MKQKHIFPALLLASCLLYACSPTELAPSSSSLGSSSTQTDASTAQPQEAIYTEADVRSAF